MNLNFIFNTVVALNFVVEFNVSPQSSQDYFLFSGIDSSAHLYRKNNTIWLYLKHGQEHQTMNYENKEPTFTFNWSSKTINDNPMSNHSDMNMSFDAYTFLSPILNIQQPHPVVAEPIFHCGETNYKLIALIIFAVGLGLKFDLVAPILVKIFKKESSYVDMQRV